MPVMPLTPPPPYQYIIKRRSSILIHQTFTHPSSLMKRHSSILIHQTCTRPFSFIKHQSNPYPSPTTSTSRRRLPPPVADGPYRHSRTAHFNLRPQPFVVLVIIFVTSIVAICGARAGWTGWRGWRGGVGRRAGGVPRLCHRRTLRRGWLRSCCGGEMGEVTL